MNAETTEAAPAAPAAKPKRAYEVVEVKGTDGKVRRIPRPVAKARTAASAPKTIATRPGEEDDRPGKPEPFGWGTVALGLVAGAVVGGVALAAVMLTRDPRTLH